MLKVLLANGSDEVAGILDARLEILLARKGMKTVGNAYYREAVVALALERKADVVVLSLHIPGSKEIFQEVVLPLRKMEKRVILLTGAADAGIRRAAVALGVYDIIPDPFMPEDVVARILRPAGFGSANDPAAAAPEILPAKEIPEKRRSLLTLLFSRLRRGRPARPPTVRSGTPGIAVLGSIGADVPGAAFCPSGEIPDGVKAVFIAADFPGPAILGTNGWDVKVYVVGSGLAAWRRASAVGAAVIPPEMVLNVAADIRDGTGDGETGRLSPLPPERRAKIVVVYSSKTAVGKTSVSANLGAILAGKGEKVCIVDADPGGHTLTSLALEGYVWGELDRPVPLPAWNMDLVPSLRDDPAVSPEAMRAKIAALRRAYDTVVVDCPGRVTLTSCIGAFLREADGVMLMTGCDNASVAAVSGFVKGGMKDLHLDGRVLLVVNRVSSASPLKPREVARKVGMDAGAVLPYDPLVDRMFAERLPVPLLRLRQKNRSPFVRSLASIAEQYFTPEKTGERS